MADEMRLRCVVCKTWCDMEEDSMDGRIVYFVRTRKGLVVRMMCAPCVEKVLAEMTDVGKTLRN